MLTTICQIDRQIIIGPKHELTQSIEMDSLKKHVKVMKNFFVCQFTDLQITEKNSHIHLDLIIFRYVYFRSCANVRYPLQKWIFRMIPWQVNLHFERDRA